MNEIPFEEHTKYSFIHKNGKDYIVAEGIELPYNHGKFKESDYYGSNSYAFWDWLKISRKERKAFRVYAQQKGPSSISDFRKNKNDMNNLIGCDFHDFECKCISLAPLPKAVPERLSRPWPDMYKEMVAACNQEGKNPMRYNDNYAVATVAAPQSDTATQREYFLNRLDSSNNYQKDRKLAKFFNLHADNTPKNYKDLIDAIKNDKFKLDDKRVKVLEAFADVNHEDDFGDYSCGPFDGIIWDGPQPDRAGYDKAIEEKARLYWLAKDTIMSSDAAAMAKAVQDFDAWMPTPATATVQ